ncbi:DUF1329 domain-containing protein [Litoribrevibacter albus]|uniref:DUF1329 domain-containing protein n=1 Tax=Litoribrevibacter albus TaxID=1473156 RepID=A0AA37SA36_9GAMM|nr:DUF1329 domain-containing protein [Litoribrevibacter albus]GLQ31254.1 hypothetical protein GCM10007876_17330 [Litoribrevibacter albus]
MFKVIALSGMAVMSSVLFSSTALANETPMGSPVEGDGKDIPRWEGGLTTPPEGFDGDYIDPFKSDTALFTITHKNVNEYAEYLTEGQKAMFRKYPDYKLPIYISRRTAAYPQNVYDALASNEKNAELLPRGTGVRNSDLTSPFPNAQTGEEMIWNHILRYRGETSKAVVSDAVVFETGAKKVMRKDIEIYGVYFDPEVSHSDRKNKIFLRKTKNLFPPSVAGQITLVHETLDQVLSPRKAWYYAPGQRRVRRTPDLEYSDELFNSDGYKTVDQVDLYNGAPDLYEWKVVGKTKKYIPYNSYRMVGENVSADSLLGEKTLNQDYTRYELHRVWHLEAVLREGIQHQYAKRVFYIDEDTWQVAYSEEYAEPQGEVWRFSEAHAINFYDVPLVWTAGNITYDLQKGGYYAEWLITNEDKHPEFNTKLNKRDFSASAMRREGRR